jgi:hypothetical protein
VAGLTGHIEGAQILADLSAAGVSGAGGGVSSGVILGVASSPQGLNCAVVLNKSLEGPAPR